MSGKGQGMQLDFVPTIGGQSYRLDDADDEAPMVELKFFNEFNEHISKERKRQLAKIALVALADALTGNELRLG